MGSPSSRDSPSKSKSLAPTHSWYSLPQRASHFIENGLKHTVYRVRFEFPPAPTPAGALNINLPDPQDCMEFHNPPPEANTRMYQEHPISLNHNRCLLSSVSVLIVPD